MLAWADAATRYAWSKSSVETPVEQPSCILVPAQGPAYDAATAPAPCRSFPRRASDATAAPSTSTARRRCGSHGGSEPVAQLFHRADASARGVPVASRPAQRRRAAITFELLAREGAPNEEGYSLHVSPERIVVSASDSRGLFYGAVTLWQLLSVGAGRGDIRRSRRDDQRCAALSLARPDARLGAALSVAEFIKRLIDVMALHKLNVLHWHLTDDQAWRLEIKKYPKLTDGRRVARAGRAGGGRGHRSRNRQAAAVRRLLHAGPGARHRGVRGRAPHHDRAGDRHARARERRRSPPIRSSAVDRRTRSRHVPADWGVYPNLFNVEEATFAFLEDVLGEVVALFPGEYVHVGGDEAVKDQWQASPRVQARMRELGVKDEHALQSYFIAAHGEVPERHGRRLIGWDEILEGGLAPNATVMSWRGIEGAVAAAAAGHDAVLSPRPTLYFDNRPLNTADSAGPRPGRRASRTSIASIRRRRR